MVYVAPDPLPWNALAGPLATAEDALARLDERLGVSPIREGWISRTHFMDACASLWLQGELVHLEDLVLHDAEMDQRAICCKVRLLEVESKRGSEDGPGAAVVGT